MKNDPSRNTSGKSERRTGGATMTHRNPSRRDLDRIISCPRCGDLLSPWTWVELNGHRGSELYYCQICGVAVSPKKEEG